MTNFNLSHAKALYLRLVTFYAERFVKPYHDEDFKNLWYSEWAEALSDIDVLCIKSVLDYCRLNLEWPPSIAEFRRLCEKSSGIPTHTQCLNDALRGEFSHPLAYLTYIKVGSWATKNDKEDVLQKKYEDAYKESLNEYRSHPDKALASFNEYKNKPKQLDTDYKITQDQIKGFRSKLAEWQAKAKLERENQEKIGHPVWDKKKVDKRSSDFDQGEYDARKKYLLSLTENEAGTLERDDWYDKTRMLREIESEEYLRRRGYTGQTQEEPKKRPSGRGYVKSWMDD